MRSAEWRRAVCQWAAGARVAIGAAASAPRLAGSAPAQPAESRREHSRFLAPDEPAADDLAVDQACEALARGTAPLAQLGRRLRPLVERAGHARIDEAARDATEPRRRLVRSAPGVPAAREPLLEQAARDA